MKSILKYMFYFFAAAVVLTGCDKTTIDVDPPGPLVGGDFENITISVSPNEFQYNVNSILEVEINASEPLPKDLTLHVTSDKPSVILPNGDYVVMAAGEKSVKAKLNCLSAGVAKITVSSPDITKYGLKELTITVKKDVPIPPNDEDKLPDVGIIKCNRAIGPGMPEMFGNLYYIKRLTPQMEYWNFTGTIEYSDRNGGGYSGEGDGLKSMIIPYVGKLAGEIVDFGGSFVGEVINGRPFLKPVPEGTEINGDLDWVGAVNQGNYFLAYFVRDAANVGMPDGEHYVVLFMAKENPENALQLPPMLPAWLKIKVEGMKLTVLDGAIRIADAESFKVGQKTL